MSIGREDYQERKENRIERLEARAVVAAQESHNAFRRSDAIISAIPAGQPIKADHYSAEGHRQLLDRADNLMKRSVEAGGKADYYASRAAAAASNTAISSDDPDALDKLKEKLDALQAAQERDKAKNAYYRKHKTMQGFEGICAEEAKRVDTELAAMRKEIRRPVPAWCLSNRNAEINRIKKRIAALQRVDQMEYVEIEFDGGKIVTNEEINRVQILFDEKPSAELRSKLKGYGFRWAPSEGAWQAPRSPEYLRRAKYILNITDEETSPQSSED